MADFIELTVYTSHVGAELVADTLWEYTELGVVINDIEDVFDLEKKGKTWDYIDEDVLKRDKTVAVSAYFPIAESYKTGEIIKRLAEMKANSPFDLGTLETATQKIDGDLWKREWKERFKPIRIGKITVVPEWIKFTPKKGEIPVYIGSNMAFGTGEHETTSMCVSFLQKYVETGDTVLDVGCGSGILGIVASKLGAFKTYLTDIDECAVKASLDNAKLNNVKNTEVLLKNLLDDAEIKGDIIVCNIMAEVLIAFAPQIGKNLKGKGVVILSGILKDRLEKVKDAYLSQSFKFVEDRTQGEWSALVVKKEIL